MKKMGFIGWLVLGALAIGGFLWWKNSKKGNKEIAGPPKPVSDVISTANQDV